MAFCYGCPNTLEWPRLPQNTQVMVCQALPWCLCPPLCSPRFLAWCIQQASTAWEQHGNPGTATFWPLVLVINDQGFDSVLHVYNWRQTPGGPASTDYNNEKIFLLFNKPWPCASQYFESFTSINLSGSHKRPIRDVPSLPRHHLSCLWYSHLSYTGKGFSP